MTRLTEMEETPGTVLFTTDFQTAGHGQKGNTWESEANQNLLFGLRIHPTYFPATHQFFLSEALALAVRVGIKNTTNIETAVKWPNDIYYGERKLCGMLLTHTLAGDKIHTTVLGAGVNVNQSRFYSDAPNPISLCQIIGKDISREVLLQAIINAFQKHILLLENGKSETLHREYKARLYRRKGLHPYRDRNGQFLARTTDVSPEGILTLERPDGERSLYHFKEITFIHP